MFHCIYCNTEYLMMHSAVGSQAMLNLLLVVIGVMVAWDLWLGNLRPRINREDLSNHLIEVHMIAGLQPNPYVRDQAVILPLSLALSEYFANYLASKLHMIMLELDICSINVNDLMH